MGRQTPIELAHHDITPTPLTKRTSGMHAPNAGTRQCITIKSDGARCERAPNRGLAVCAIHGGSTPLAKQSASRMFLRMVEPAISTLFDALQADTPGGDPDWKSRIAAAKTLLSRAGFGESSTLNVEGNHGDLGHRPINDLADELISIGSAIKKLPPTIDVTPDPEPEIPEYAAPVDEPEREYEFIPVTKAKSDE